MREVYPVTITMDRYGGTYSGGSWLAFNTDVCGVPTECFADDLTCAMFWREVDENTIGIGETPDQALFNLKVKKYGTENSI